MVLLYIIYNINHIHIHLGLIITLILPHGSLRFHCITAYDDWHCMIIASVVFETTYSETESRPRPEQIESESRPKLEGARLSQERDQKNVSPIKDSDCHFIKSQ